MSTNVVSHASTWGSGRLRHRMNVRLRISWSSELAGNYSRIRTLSAPRCKKGSGFLVNVLRGGRLFVDIFRVGS